LSYEIRKTATDFDAFGANCGYAFLV